MKSFIKGVFGAFGYRLFKISGDGKEIWTNPPSTKKHERVFPYATYSPWLDDATFQESYRRIQNNTLVDIFRCFELWSLAKQVQHIEGDLLEVGVWRGGTGALIAKAVSNNPSKKVYLADTFSGVVKAGKRDTIYVGGEHKDTSAQIVRNLVEVENLTNIVILEGIFPDETAKGFVGDKIALLHCDVDVYESTRDIIEWALPRLSIGSILVFDDFGFSGCEGVSAYCEELALNEQFHFIHNLNGHAIFVKFR